MKKLLLVVVIALQSILASAQVNPYVVGIINQVDLDTLTKYVNELSGEVPVVVNGTSTTIQHRISWSGNDLAADYLVEKLEGFGFTVTDQSFNTDGRNIFAEQTGTQFPDEKYIICAHYDAVANYCADDNASGTACVLEAARILSQEELPYTLVYALWDEEEVGLYGSDYYAGVAASNGDVIKGVINLDMIAWDNDNDGDIEIHSGNTANTAELAASVVEINTAYGFDLNTNVFNPGATASDHASFWDEGYGALLFIEEYYGNDFNPYYHTDNDRISICNLPYFFEVSKLAIGTFTTWAMGETIPAPSATFTPEDGATDIAIDETIVVNFNTAMRNLDDSEITSPAELITMKKGTSTGEDVAFSAAINSDKTKITITPDEDLAYNQVYYVEMSDQVENEDDVQFNGASIMFTTINNIGIDKLAVENAKIYPNPAQDVVNIELANTIEDALVIEVLDLSGKLVLTQTFSGSENLSIDVSNLDAGMYILNIKSERFSVMKKISVS